MKKFLLFSLVAFAPLYILATFASLMAPTKEGSKAAVVVDRHFGSDSRSFFVGQGRKRTSFFVYPESAKRFEIYQVENGGARIVPSRSTFVIFVLQFVIASAISIAGIILIKVFKGRPY